MPHLYLERRESCIHDDGSISHRRHAIGRPTSTDADQVVVSGVHCRLSDFNVLQRPRSVPGYAVLIKSQLIQDTRQPATFAKLNQSKTRAKQCRFRKSNQARSLTKLHKSRTVLSHTSLTRQSHFNGCVINRELQSMGSNQRLYTRTTKPKARTNLHRCPKFKACANYSRAPRFKSCAFLPDVKSIICAFIGKF